MESLLFYTVIFLIWFTILFGLGEHANRLIGKIYKGSDGNLGRPVARLLGESRLRIRAHHLSGGRLVGSLFVAWLMLRFGTDLSLWIMVPSGILLVLTDVIDGPSARQYQSISSLGKLLDSIADKFFKVVYSIRFIHLPVIGLMLWITYFLYLISASALVMKMGSSSTERVADAFEANHFGKAKMFFQCSALGTLYLWELFPQFTVIEISAFLLVSALPFELKSQFEKAKGMYRRRKLKEQLQVISQPEAG